MKTPNLVGVIYVGKKPTAHDNVAGSGKVWNGNGDVQEVTELQAATLTKYRDQWAYAPTDNDVGKAGKGGAAKGNGSNQQQSADNNGSASLNGSSAPGSGNSRSDPNQPPNTGGSDDSVSPEELAEILKTPLEKLTKPKLVIFAKHKLGKDLDPALGKTDMVNQVEEWLKTAE